MVDSAQLYETTILDRRTGQAFSFVTVPARSLPSVEIQPVEVLAERLGLAQIRGVEGERLRVAPIEPWSLPFLIDVTLGREWPGFPFGSWFRFEPPNRRGPSAFAQYVTYSRVVPFESSPLAGVALADLVATSEEVGAVFAALADEPLLLLVVPAGIIVCGAARGVGEALRIGLRAKLLALMGVPDPHGPDALEWYEGDEPSE